MTEMVFELKTLIAKMGILCNMHRKEKCELPWDHERTLAIWISDHHENANLRFFFFPSALYILHSAHAETETTCVDEVCLHSMA